MQKQKIYLAKYKPCNMHVGQVTRYIFFSIFTFLSQNKKDNNKKKNCVCGFPEILCWSSLNMESYWCAGILSRSPAVFPLGTSSICLKAK